MVVLDPVGQVGIEERNLIITATLLMLLVVVPVILMTLIFAWKYRASNKNATYAPKWSHSTKIEVVIWTVPILIIIALGVITYKSTHALDPYRPLESDVKPVTISGSTGLEMGIHLPGAKVSLPLTRSCSQPTRLLTSALPL